MSRKTMIILATVLALGSAPLSTTAFARDGGGGHSGGAGHAAGGSFGGHFGGEHGSQMASGGREAPSGGSHESRHHFNSRSNDVNTLSSDDYCYQPRRYHTSTAWHTRYVYTCG